jgi:GT2 family glycosyltransferase
MECIQTVECFLKQDLPLKISIVDNASDPENYQALIEHLPSKVELLRLEKNKGWGGGLNVLLQRWLEEKSDEQNYCFISAHDALPQNNCLNMLLECIEGDSKIGIACPEYGSARDFPHYSPLRGPRYLPSPPRPAGKIEPVDFAHTTLFVISRECLKEIGLFDERYFAYGDDCDMSLKARRYGWKVVLLWGAILINPISGTSKPVLNYLLARNTILLALTYGGWKKAIARMLIVFMSALKLTFMPAAKRMDFCPGAKLMGIRDFLRGRFGPPPINL